MSLIDKVFDYFFGYVKQLFIPRKAMLVEDKQDNVLIDDEDEED